MGNSSSIHKNKKYMKENQRLKKTGVGDISILWEDDPNEADQYFQPKKTQDYHQRPHNLLTKDHNREDENHDKRSYGGSSGRTTSSHLRSMSLRSNLMRQQKEGRSPLDYYEVIKVLGVGSMGSVSKVKKLHHVVGGSAREELQEDNEDNPMSVLKDCFSQVFDVCLGNRTEKTIQPLVISPQVSAITTSSSSPSSVPPSPLHQDRHSSAAVATSPNQSNKNKNRVSFRLDPTDSSGRGGNDSSRSSTGDGSDYAGTGSDASNHELIPSRKRRSYGTSPRARGKSAGGREQQQEFFYAMKSIHLNRIADPTFINELKNEIEILKSLDHPNIVRPIETFEHSNQLFVVMELCSGGDLYTRDPYTEEDAARIIFSILSAITYMHNHNVIHRDLKYENCLFVNTSLSSEVKLIDFGLSRCYSSTGQTLTEGVGTIYTMAPEVLKGSYTSQADLWSVGVLAYMLLSSQMPFYGKKRRHIVEQIIGCKYSMHGRRWKGISKEAKEFVKDLLVLDPNDRLTAEEASASVWLNKSRRSSMLTQRAPRIDEINKVQQSIQTYSNYSKMKKLALTVIAHKSTTEEIGVLRKVFQQYDTDRNGVISYKEFKAALRDYDHDDLDIEDMFDALDLDGTGKIRYTEFIAATIEAQGVINEERLAEAFDRLDDDDSGYITVKNLRQILGEDMNDEDIEDIISDVDITQDGRIAYHEFLALWEDKEEDKRTATLEEMFPPRDSRMSLCDLPHQIELDLHDETAMQQNRQEDQPALESSSSSLIEEGSVSSENNHLESSTKYNGNTTISRANFLEAKCNSERRTSSVGQAPITI